MSEIHGIIAALALNEGEAVRYWLAEGDRLAQIDSPADHGEMPVMLLLPARQSTLRWSEVGELAPKQAEAAARLQAGQAAIGGADFAHIVAAIEDGERIVVATVAATTMTAALDALARDGINPDIILPAALVLPCPEAGFAAGLVADEAMLRSADLALTDEPALRLALVGEAPVTQIAPEVIESALIRQLAEPILNLRQGRFAKKRKGQWGSAQVWRLAAWLLGIALVASLLIGIITWFKYDREVAAEDDKALVAAQKAIPSIQSVEAAEPALDAELGRRGVALQRFTSTSAALYSAVQAAPGVTLRDLRQGRDGLLVATLAAPQIDPVNAALIRLQQAGYKITATPRQDASGLAMAEITVRAQ